MNPPAPSPAPPGVIEVAAALVFREGKLLVTQRPPGTHLAGLWEFPGGKREAHETWEQCLSRELIEELGISVHVGPLYSEIQHDYPTKSVLLRFFLASLAPGSPEPRPIECAAIRWISRTDLSSIEFPPADARLIQQLHADLSLWH
jgi:mutator protein MutT